jgi:hypothetical protein
MYHEKVIQNKFNRELHVYYQYGSSQSFQWGSNYLLIEVLSKILSIQTWKTNDKNDNMKTLVNYQNGFVLITL